MKLHSQSRISPQEQPRIDACFQAGHPLLSFEFFPPKDDAARELLFEAIEDLKPLGPDFISVTRTGAGTQQTLELTGQIQNDLGFRAMAHLTCAHHTRTEMGDALDTLWHSGIRNVLALRGDAPDGVRPTGPEAFDYADDLVRFARERHDFCIGVAGYPEGHPQCLNLSRDIEMLQRKLDAGAQFVITQLFFGNEDFLHWRDKVRGHGHRRAHCRRSDANFKRRADQALCDDVRRENSAPVVAAHGKLGIRSDVGARGGRRTRDFAVRRIDGRGRRWFAFLHAEQIESDQSDYAVATTEKLRFNR